MDLRWSTETYHIPRLLDNVEFPQLLKLVLGAERVAVFYGKTADASGKVVVEDTYLKDGDVLKLHGVRTFKKVIVTGAGGQTSCEQIATEYGYLSPPGSNTIYNQYMIPAQYSSPLRILPYRGNSFVYASAADVIKEHPRPTAVVVNKAISLPEKHCVIKEGDVLAITSVDKRCTNSGVVDFLVCKHNDKTVGLPASCVGNFTPLPDETLFSLNDLVSKHMDIGFPQKICFQPMQAASSNTQTLARGGEQQIIAGNEYVAENVIKQQYLICTRCEESRAGLSNLLVYYIPSSSGLVHNYQVRVPLFMDSKSCEQVLNNRYCPNLSIRDLVDATPIELVGQSNIAVKKLSEVYEHPQVPPRRDVLATDASPPEPGRYFADREGNYANMRPLQARLHSSHVHLKKGRSKEKLSNASEQMGSHEEQPLLGGADSPPLHRNDKKGPQRRGMSTPCTPESRRKKTEPSTWSEKISISLENLKRTFRKGGSEERERSKIGDGSQLADSFENISMNGEEPTDVQADYINVQLVAKQLPPPRQKDPNPKCAQIKELWTPPCSPDYRDHTTPADTFNFKGESPLVREGSGLQFVDIEGGNPLKKTASQSALNSHLPAPAPEHSRRHAKSPRPAPRLNRECVESSAQCYRNIERVLPGDTNCPIDEKTGAGAGRCSGYSSSSSRGSSENDLIHYQLDSIKTVDMIPDDLSCLTVSSLCDCLHLFELHNVALKFRQNQVDGQFFTVMSDHLFTDDAFNFTQFELLKLRQLRDGWRPKF